MKIRLVSVVVLLVAVVRAMAAEPKTCGVYSSIVSFAGHNAMEAAIKSDPSFLKDKHKKSFAGSNNAGEAKAVHDAGFNTVFMTLYPLWGVSWWDIPAARGMVSDAVKQCSAQKVKVHLGLSLFNAQFCEKPEIYPGASRTIQCDGTRPSWVCFFEDKLWDAYTKNMVEMAKISLEAPETVTGVFVDPEAYGPECYLCFCDNCVKKFNAYAGENMPTGLVKPDGWLYGHGLWKKYTVDWHDQEVRRHAVALREAVDAVNPKLQISSLLWDYPVAVGIGDARQAYFRTLAIGLGTAAKPSWVLPEHTYYSDGADLDRIIRQVNKDIEDAAAKGQVKVLPGIRPLRQTAASFLERGKVIRDDEVPGYWIYEWSDFRGKAPIDFEGELIDPPTKYLEVLAEMNRMILGGSGAGAGAEAKP